MTSGRSRLHAAATARLARFTETSPHTSFLSVSSAAALGAVGIEAVGDAMGCATTQISHEWVGMCGMTSTQLAATPMRGRGGGWEAHGSYQARLRDLYGTALARLRAEATAMHADGVVGITITLEQHETLHEVVAVGTAVRARSRTRPAEVFTTDLTGPDVAKLMLRGWAPVALHVAVRVGIRHVDYQTAMQSNPARSNRVNQEVGAYSELRQRTSQGVRETLRGAVKGAGADGCLLSSLHTATWHKHCERLMTNSDRVARSVAIGTSVVRFAGPRTPTPAPTLRMLPVGGRA